MFPVKPITFWGVAASALRRTLHAIRIPLPRLHRLLVAVLSDRASGPGPISHLHLDPLGGMAGDMFVAALLDAFPQHAAAAVDAATTLSGVACRLDGYRDAVLTGARFAVAAAGPQQGHGDSAADYAVDARAVALLHAEGHIAANHRAEAEASHRAEAEHGDHHGHDPAGDHQALDRHRAGGDHAHTAWRDIRDLIAGSVLPSEVRHHAIGIFSHLAEAEAQVHGIPVDDVAFHEVGNADSIADIVAAAWLIAAFPAATWSVGPIPLGSGRVRTAHGMLPVPAPATALLLQGLPTIDDGIAGERVTPTGAAILRHLAPVPRHGLRGSIVRTGIGFGTRALPGMSNVVRVLAFTSTAAGQGTGRHRELSVIAFEVDDQSPEDLAAGLDRLRAHDGVHDVLQMPAFGKKGRMTAHVQVLARPDATDAVVEACFRETTTIGLRLHTVQGRALRRRIDDVRVGEATLRVKSVDRPGGRTGKAEVDDVLAQTAAGAGHAARVRLRRSAEQRAAELRAGDRCAGEQRAGELRADEHRADELRADQNRTGEKHRANDHHWADEQQTAGHSVDKRSADAQSADDHRAGGQRIAGHAHDDQTADDHCAGERWVHEHPDDGPDDA